MPGITLIALISDLHGEAGALAAVEAELTGLGVDEVWCLGDSVDWLLPREPLLRGNPAALRRVRERCRYVLAGNHEFALLDDPLGVERIEEEPDSVELLAYLRALTPQLQIDSAGASITLVHASLSEPYWAFIETADDVADTFRRSSADLICFGHTHLPFLASVDGSGQVEVLQLPPPGNWQPLTQGRRWLLNPGSAGRAPVAHLASWALLQLDEQGMPAAVSWRHTSWRPQALFGR